MLQENFNLNGNGESKFPRKLSVTEKDLLLWLLPENKTGYKKYRDYLNSSNVIGFGRRGIGNLILSDKNISADLDIPLPQVFAFGMVVGKTQQISVSIREIIYDQLEIEIDGLDDKELVIDFNETKRWSFSDWSEKKVCPICTGELREIKFSNYILVFCKTDERIWINNLETGVNHLIPITNYYNELMLLKNIRDPILVLNSKNLFNSLETFTNNELINSFIAYNRLRKKVDINNYFTTEQNQTNSFLKKFSSLFSR